MEFDAGNQIPLLAGVKVIAADLLAGSTSITLA